jgi:hypothetical protein
MVNTCRQISKKKLVQNLQNNLSALHALHRAEVFNRTNLFSTNGTIEPGFVRQKQTCTFRW